MGNCGYRILLWDDYGWGLVMINPRLLIEGEDMYGNPLNWWPCSEEGITDEEVIEKHKLEEEKYYIILYDDNDLT